MYDQAVAKIKTEMERNKKNAYIQAVGSFLLQHLQANPADAEKIVSAGEKTVAKSLDEMRKEAQKKKVGNCAVLTDAEGFAIVLKYFGIDAAPQAAAPATPSAPPVMHRQPPAQHNSIDFDVKLEDLLEE